MDKRNAEPEPGPRTAMGVLDAIYGRRSIRDYEAREPSRDLIQQILADAVQAPNAMNRQAWDFIVVRGRDRLAEISRHAKAHALATATLEAAPELRALLENETFDIFYNAPALVVICATSPDAMVAQDCCLAAQTLMLSAFARGLGSCWIGFAEAWLKTPQGKAQLGAAPGQTPIAPVIIGHPRTAPPPTGRRAPQIAWIDGAS